MAELDLRLELAARYIYASQGRLIEKELKDFVVELNKVESWSTQPAAEMGTDDARGGGGITL